MKGILAISTAVLAPVFCLDAVIGRTPLWQGLIAAVAFGMAVRFLWNEPDSQRTEEGSNGK